MLFSEGFDASLQARLTSTGTLRRGDPSPDNLKENGLRPIADQANRAGVVIYSFDARGLAYTGISASDRVQVNTRTPPRAASLAQDRLTGYRDSQSGLEYLSRETGGLFIHDQNQFDAGLAKALDDLNGYYLIGYQPQRNDIDKTKPQFHRIAVKVKRPGLHVRSRTGYFGEPDAPTSSNPETTRQEQIARALQSPFQINDIGLELHPFYSQAMDASSSRSILRGIVQVDLKDIAFHDVGGSMKHGDVALVCAAYDIDGQLAGSSDQVFAMEATPEQLAKQGANKIHYQIEIPITKPGAYQIRTAARDEATGKTGAANAFVQVPDYHAGELALSSLVLYKQDGAMAVPRDGDPEGFANAAGKVFEPGTSLGYALYVYNASAAAKLTMELRLFKDGEQIFAGAPLPVATSKKSSAPPAMGKLKIPPGMAPGDYAVALVIHDGERTAMQWTDFTLISAAPHP